MPGPRRSEPKKAHESHLCTMQRVGAATGAMAIIADILYRQAGRVTERCTACTCGARTRRKPASSSAQSKASRKHATWSQTAVTSCGRRSYSRGSWADPFRKRRATAPHWCSGSCVQPELTCQPRRPQSAPLPPVPVTASTKRCQPAVMSSGGAARTARAAGWSAAAYAHDRRRNAKKEYGSSRSRGA